MKLLTNRNITAHKVIAVAYKKELGNDEHETTHRDIIPTSIDGSNLKALDVTNWDISRIESTEAFLVEYDKYLNERYSNMLAFGEWYTQVAGISLSDQSLSDIQNISSNVQEYYEYYTAFKNTIFSFVDWLAHTHRITDDFKWRTFKLDKLKILTE